jgi:very-short-patch-repair endonuclease
MLALAPSDAAAFVFAAPPRRVATLVGDAAPLRAALDAENPDGRVALFVALEAAATADAIVRQAIETLAETALRLWPFWWGDALFERDDPLSQAANAIGRGSWAAAATRLAAQGHAPRVADAHPTLELAELSRVIAPRGLALIVDAEPLCARPEPGVTALEGVARHIDGAVIAVFATAPPESPPFDRILAHARQLAAPSEPAAAPETPRWLSPWRGRPHPLSAAEMRLAAALSRDKQLSPLFEFNAVVEATWGAKYKVDLLWRVGRLVVEVDGFAVHGHRIAFAADRHRDYELVLNGYAVLRLTNDEIAEDVEKALEKIRNLVNLGGVARTRSP